MASILPHRDGYRVQVYVGGQRLSKVCATRREAAQWALEREAELAGRKLPDKTLRDALRRYASELDDDRGGARWERIRLAAFERDPLALRRLAALGPDDFAAWRDARLRTQAQRRQTTVAPATVAREMNLLRSVLETARKEWRWLRTNPMADVSWPKSPKGRARRITPEEEADLTAALGVATLRADTATQRVGLAFLLALETAMRSGEILALTWPNIHLAEQYVHLPRTKNGDARDVPLSKRAVEILRAMPLGFGPVFQLDAAARDALWRKARAKTPHRDVHFHDSRAEAIWRLSKKLDVLELARVIGHRDVNSLLIYYRESASAIARKLG